MVNYLKLSYFILILFFGLFAGPGAARAQSMDSAPCHAAQQHMGVYSLSVDNVCSPSAGSCCQSLCADNSANAAIPSFATVAVALDGAAVFSRHFTGAGVTVLPPDKPPQ